MNKHANSISLLRLITCICIFIFHYLTNFTSFNTLYFPSDLFVFIFAFLSGFLYGPKTITNGKTWIWKNIKKLAIPMLVYVVIFSVIILMTGLIKYTGDFSQAIGGFVGKNSITGAVNFVFGNLWFLGILSIAYIFTPLLHKLTRKQYATQPTILLSGSIVVICLCEMLFNFFCPVFTVYVISYLIGFKYFSRISYEKEKNWYFYLIVALICAGGFSFWYLWVVSHPVAGYLDFGTKLLYYFVQIINAISVTLLFLRAFRSLNESNIKFFKYTDKYSFPFYMIHQSFMTGVLCFSELINPLWVYGIICFILTICAAVPIQLIGDKILNKINLKSSSTTKQ